MRIDENERSVIETEIKLACARLMELGCDSVQVIATAPFVGDAFVNFNRGEGNLFARYGATQCWLDNQKNMDVANEFAAATGN